MRIRPVGFEYEGQVITARQVQILRCCANGMTYKKTADQLCMSRRTVQRHRENIRHRFCLEGYHALECFAIKLLPELEKWA